MPIFKNKVLAGNQFTGTTSSDGLFDPNTGADKIQVRINSLSFHTTAASDFVATLNDPTDSANSTVVLSDGSVVDVYLTDILLPTEDNKSWALKVVTTTMSGDGWLTIDYDFQPTEGA